MKTSNKSSNFTSRVATGTTFFALEHSLNLLFTVVLALLIVGGSVAVIALWTGGLLQQSDILGSFFLSGTAICMAAALLSLSPLVWLLDSRTRAEASKRAGFTTRLAYKVPLYVAMGVVALIKVGAWISLFAVVLFTLAAIGTSPLALAGLWTTQFTPALITIIVFGVTGWFLMKQAKGTDDGRSLTQILVSVGVLLGLALFVSATITIQSSNTVYITTPPTLENALRSYMEPPTVESVHEHKPQDDTHFHQ